ncbi:MAG TPA: alpha/beta hydrolase [Gammaproteobacteria bacterium]|nr:alpha/beta hydrolase [Gammaproteobacteria bacterium]
MATLLLCSLFIAERANAEPQWKTLPPTPVLPKAEHSGYAPINGTKIWYAEFGHGKPIILLHGGFANSNYWGNQVPVLAKNYEVIVMDSRGQGRSGNNEKSLGYDLMASDVIGLMDFLKIKQAAIVGWSDGGIIGLDIAIHHPERLTKLFAFGANSDVHGTNPDVVNSAVFNAYVARTKTEYEKLSPTPSQYQSLSDQVNKMWATQPNFTKAQLNSITVPTWIVDGDHDEGIKRDNTEFMAANIPNAGLLIQPSVSHFSFLQNPQQFNNDLLDFLAMK